jgi:hypothetical protein
MTAVILSGLVFWYIHSVETRSINQNRPYMKTYMKRYLIGAMFILAAIFPILFFPILAITLVTIFLVIPYAAKHGVWGEDHKTSDDLHHAA